jgi:hypothetical protein
MASGGLLAKGWRRPVGAMAILAVFAWQVPLLSQPPPAREASVRLSWQPGWTSAGIAVEPGDTLSIRVRTIKGAAGEPQQICERPITGAPTHCRQADTREKTLSDTLLTFAARQVIVGRLGEGKPFVVGRSFKKVMDAGGPLSLRWNVPREAAGAARGFDVTIRVEPAAEEWHDLPDLNVNSYEPPRNVVGPIDTAVNDSVPTEKETGPTNDQGGLPEQNLVSPAGPTGPQSPGKAMAGGEPKNEVTAEDVGTDLPAGQLALIGGSLAALAVVLAAAGFGVQRMRRRRLVERTRSMLGLAPSLDLGEGACRGGDRPAGGPAASLRARLEDEAVRKPEGGGDG